EAEEAEREQRLLAESLRDTAAVLNSTLHLDEVLDRVLDNAERVISGPHDVANIMLLEEHTARVVRYREYVDHGLDPDEQLRVRLPIDRAHSLKTVIESGESFIIPDARDYPGWVETPSNTWVRSVITVPIRLQGEVIGFLDLNSTEPNAFTRDHAVKLQAFADQAAAAINNAQLFETVQRYADELVERNQELDSFSHTVAHDLRAPLHLIAGYANLIEISDPSTVPPDVVQFAREVVEAANKMADMIENLLLLATLRDTSQVIGAVEMEPVITSALRRYRRTIERRGFTIEVSPDLPPVMGHGPWLEEIFANLISNAIKYIGEDNAAPHIAIRARQEGGMARYEVQDNGIGISPENQQRLFEAFARFAQAEASGFGLGLSIVLRIVRKLSGQVGVESVPGEGSLFWVRLPAAQTISEPAAAPVES
ncbi:MAG: GAF domain-containing sensor histidine kinase, partial [Anaerolineae bacterium]|nr:GAF domain-containing sensor histidine kinase [Anaerolineae bacterium]